MKEVVLDTRNLTGPEMTALIIAVSNKSDYWNDIRIKSALRYNPFIVYNPKRKDFRMLCMWDPIVPTNKIAKNLKEFIKMLDSDQPDPLELRKGQTVYARRNDDIWVLTVFVVKFKGRFYCTNLDNHVLLPYNEVVIITEDSWYVVHDNYHYAYLQLTEDEIRRHMEEGKHVKIVNNSELISKLNEKHKF